MVDHQISILEEHGYNSDIFLFGDANVHPMKWFDLIAFKIGGIVSRIHFCAPNLIGLLALIRAETPSSSLSFPDDTFFSHIDRSIKRYHLKSIIDGVCCLRHDTGHLEASFIGDGYHLDFVRGNFAQLENENTHIFPAAMAKSVEETHLPLAINPAGASRFASKINEAKFGVRINGTNSLIVSISENGNILVASNSKCDRIPFCINVDQDGIHAYDDIGGPIFDVFSPELIAHVKMPLSSPIYFAAYNELKILEWHRFNT